MASTADKALSPFLNVTSFESERMHIEPENLPIEKEAFSPFLTAYQGEASDDLADPLQNEIQEFIAEIQDEAFDNQILELVSQAAVDYQDNFVAETGGSSDIARRTLEARFDPLITEAENFVQGLVEIAEVNGNATTDYQIDDFVNGYVLNESFSPEFEQFFGGLKKKLKKIAKKGIKLAKKGVKAAAKLGLGPVLKKLKRMIKPLIRKVLKFAIGRLPKKVRGPAKIVARKLKLIKEVDDDEDDSALDVLEIQQEFDGGVAELMFVDSEVEQEAFIVEYEHQSIAESGDNLEALDVARERFIQELNGADDDVDLTPQLEQFIPAILAAVRIGIKIIGRKKVVNFLAGKMSRYLKRFVGKSSAKALSRAIVDTGLSMASLETSDDTAGETAANVVSATVEDTVRQVAALPEYVLENEALLEGYVLDAFEKSAAKNMPNVLPDTSYKTRTSLRESAVHNGAWTLMPARGRKFYKKYSRVIPTKLTPHNMRKIRSFGGVALADRASQELGIDTSQEIPARVHVYETIPGTYLPGISRLEKRGDNASGKYSALHPLTPRAAAVIFGEPHFGVRVPSRYLKSPCRSRVGQRFYQLEFMQSVPAAVAPTASLATGIRVNLVKRDIRVRMFLPEAKAQQIATLIRQNAAVGVPVARMTGYLDERIATAIRAGNLVVIPRRPSLSSPNKRRLTAETQFALGKGIADFVTNRSADFIGATEAPENGLTVLLSFSSSDALSLFDGKTNDGAPGKTVNHVEVHVVPGQQSDY